VQPFFLNFILVECNQAYRRGQHIIVVVLNSTEAYLSYNSDTLKSANRFIHTNAEKVSYLYAHRHYNLDYTEQPKNFVNCMEDCCLQSVLNCQICTECLNFVIRYCLNLRIFDA
jgi:hypothetical protein